MSSDTTPRVEFVITAPAPYGAEMAYRARARTTLGVLTQLIAQAQQCVVIATPFISLGEGTEADLLTDALRAALQCGVSVDVVSTGEGLQAVNVRELRRMARGRLRLLQPRVSMTDVRRLGSHAKFCVADSWHAYIGSANLTGPGLSTNLEMGVLVHGELAHQVSEFWKHLCEIGFFVEVG